MNNTLLNIGPFDTVFSLIDKQKVIIKVGYQQLIEQHFKHKLPTPYEIEMAIITIEDAIESAQSSGNLTTLTDVAMSKSDIDDIAKLLKVEHQFNAAQLEFEFNRVADIIMGSPAHYGELPESTEFVSKLLILRELMHHLRIEQITII